MIKYLTGYQVLDMEVIKLQSDLNTMQKKIDWAKQEGTETKNKLSEEIQKISNLYNDILAQLPKGLDRVKLFEEKANELENYSVEELKNFIGKCKKSKDAFDILKEELEKIKKKSEVIEELRAKMKKCHKMRKDFESKIPEVSEKLEKQKAELETERKIIEKNVPKDLIKTYDTLRKIGQVPCIIRINEENICIRCNEKLSQKQCDDIKDKEYTICEKCGRILIK